MRRIPSQADIAAAANVSTATVSRVVNNSSLVSEGLRERVLAEMERLGYYPHGAARALAYNRSWTIGAVVPTLDSDLFARGIDALMKRLREKDYSLMVVSSDYSLEDEAHLVRRLLERGVDGLFLVGQERLPDTAKLLERSGRPYVESYISDCNDRSGFIGFSNYRVSTLAVDHLYRIGHRQIGMLAAITHHNDRAFYRVKGFRARVRELGLELNEHWVREIIYDIDVARRAFGDLLDSQNYPTAMLCGNDLIAMGVLIEAQARGFPIPDCMSVVGIDDHPMSRHTNPPLTTIAIPAKEIGTLAADALIESIEQGKSIGRYEMDAPLVVRGTTASPEVHV
ncbi:MAG: LacI family transcriptional regulator [Proteobacteria bacterium]|nr:MAG: LacI family transcriptional regulator [Pseudomonadota bacterium]